MENGHARLDGSRQRPVRPVRRMLRRRGTRRRASAAQSPRLDRPRKTCRRKGDARLLRHRPSARSSTRDKVAELATHTTVDISKASTKGAEVALCGILTGIQRKRNKEGKPWAAMQLEDLAGLPSKPWCSPRSTSVPRACSNEDKAVLIRGLVLPEEDAPPKISVQDIVPLEVARVDLPSLISISRASNGAAYRTMAPSRRSTNLFRAQARRHRSPPAPRKAARLLGYPGCDRPRSGRTRNSAPKSNASAAPKRWKSWRTDASRSLSPQSEWLTRQTPRDPNPSWERVQLARHPKRPHSLDYIQRLFTDFGEIHGDRAFARRSTPSSPASACSRAAP